MNLKDVKLIPELQPVNDIPHYPRLSYVKAEHIPTGITVTAINRSQPKAKEEALKQLEMLLYLWNGDE